jgi:hypothetical protein
MAPQILLSPQSHYYVDGRAAKPIIPAAAKGGARSVRDAVLAIGGLIWAALAYRRAFKRAAAQVAGDLFDAPDQWADISARAWEQARLSSEGAGAWRLASGAGTLIAALAFCAALVQILI